MKIFIKLGKEVGLDENSIVKMLKSIDFKNEVNLDINKAKSLNITSLPAFVFNNKHIIPGAQPEEVFLNSLHSILEEERKSNETKKSSYLPDNNSFQWGVLLFLTNIFFMMLVRTREGNSQ